MSSIQCCISIRVRPISGGQNNNSGTSWSSATQQPSPAFVSSCLLRSLPVGSLGTGRLCATAMLAEQWVWGLVTNPKPQELLGFGYAEDQGEACCCRGDTGSTLQVLRDPNHSVRPPHFGSVLWGRGSGTPTEHVCPSSILGNWLALDEQSQVFAIASNEISPHFSTWQQSYKVEGKPSGKNGSRVCVEL